MTVTASRIQSDAALADAALAAAAITPTPTA
jgi:hypothetical protein